MKKLFNAFSMATFALLLASGCSHTSQSNKAPASAENVEDDSYYEVPYMNSEAFLRSETFYQ